MIIAPTSCYFVVKTDGEAAGNAVTKISPRVSADIVSAILISADFDSDIQAVQLMDQVASRILEQVPTSNVETLVKYNPLFVPSTVDSVDEVLHLEPHRDSIRFIGLDGNPFLFKTIEVKSEGQQLLLGKVEYRPFDMPSYSEIIGSCTKQLN